MRTNDCDLYMDLMPLVRDGAASETTRQVLQAHITVCEACRSVYEQLPNTAPIPSEAERTLERIRKQWFRGALAMVVLGITVSLCVTSFRGMTVLNFVLLPLVGIAAYIALRWKGWLVPLGVMAVSFLGMLGRYTLIDGDALSDVWANTLLLTVYYGFLCAFGVMMSHLCHYVFAHLDEATRWERVKKRLGRILLAVWYAVIVVGITGFFQVFFGNPVAKASAEGDAAYYVEANYRGHDFTVGEAEYNMKRGGYSVWVYSTSSVDTRFEIGYNMLGIRTWDSYDQYVPTGWTTYWRLDDEYLAVVTEVLEASGFTPVGYQIKLLPHMTDDEPARSGLELDEEYDLNLWAYDSGTIGVTCTLGDRSIAELMLEIRRLMDEAGLGFATLNLRIEYESGNRYYVVPYDGITAENLEENYNQYQLP